MPPFLNCRALLAIGWSRGLITAILGKPDLVAKRKRRAKHLYAADRIQAGMLDPRFLALVAKRKERAQVASARLAAIPARYANWPAALGDASAAMHQLNRYAHHRRCRPLQRQEIYRLLGEFFETLNLRPADLRSGRAAPSAMTRAQVAEALTLVRWVLEQARGCVIVDAASPFDLLGKVPGLVCLSENELTTC